MALHEIIHPSVEKLLQRLREMDIAKKKETVRLQVDEELVVIVAKKIIRYAQMEALKFKLRSSRKNHEDIDSMMHSIG
ncbi:hypothetical protein E3N88_05115 [Mikania micrantha]|uniref:Uncharacterized protein n=1 Tax=Mikania micrantha TaxID=192012 RepID=A0A5N6PXU3_9ASTR|nr:hypothetical protein E3N88_05115 [Mikania micrantha]